jgi:hypothetical protein
MKVTDIFWLRRGKKKLVYIEFEIFIAVTTKNAAFWNINTQFAPHRRHTTSLLQRPTGYFYVRFVVFTAVTLKNAFFWDMKLQFLPHRKHITSPLQSLAG